MRRGLVFILILAAVMFITVRVTQAHDRIHQAVNVTNNDTRSLQQQTQAFMAQQCAQGVYVDCVTP